MPAHWNRREPAARGSNEELDVHHHSSPLLRTRDPPRRTPPARGARILLPSSGASEPRAPRWKRALIFERNVVPKRKYRARSSRIWIWQLGRAEGAEESRTRVARPECRTTSTWKTHDDIVLVASHRGVRTPSRPRGVGPHRPGLASEPRVFDDDDDDDDDDCENVLGLQLSPGGPGTGPGCRHRWIPAVRGHPGVLRFRDQGFG